VKNNGSDAVFEFYRKQKTYIAPGISLVFLIAGLILNIFLPIKKVIKPPYNYLGVFLIVLGVWPNIWADRLFKMRNTTVNPFEKTVYLIKDGPFRLSRHPMYLGMLITVLGTAVLMGSLSPFICVLGFFIVISRFFMPHEEKAMQEAFGEEYIKYKEHVRRWI
jgi:protein-S-isoprenylcysteine O-methyltransferase Ste14